MKIQSLVCNPNIVSKGIEKQQLNNIVYTDDGYVKIPQAKYENNKMWSNLLILLLSVDLVFAIYRYFKK